MPAELWLSTTVLLTPLVCMAPWGEGAWAGVMYRSSSLWLLLHPDIIREMLLPLSLVQVLQGQFLGCWQHISLLC